MDLIGPVRARLLDPASAAAQEDAVSYVEREAVGRCWSPGLVERVMGSAIRQSTSTSLRFWWPLRFATLRTIERVCRSIPGDPNLSLALWVMLERSGVRCAEPHLTIECIRRLWAWGESGDDRIGDFFNNWQEFVYRRVTRLLQEIRMQVYGPTDALPLDALPVSHTALFSALETHADASIDGIAMVCALHHFGQAQHIPSNLLDEAANKCGSNRTHTLVRLMRAGRTNEPMIRQFIETPSLLDHDRYRLPA